MSPRLLLALLLLVTLQGCLSAPSEVEAEFQAQRPNHYDPRVNASSGG